MILPAIRAGAWLGMLLLLACERQVNPGVDFLVCRHTPESSCIVETSDNGSRRVHLGWFDRPFADPNVRAALNGPRPMAGQKRWQFFLLTHARVRVGIAVADLGYGGQAFVSLYDAETGEHHRCVRTIPASHVGVAASSLAGRSACHAPGLWVAMVNNDAAGHQLLFAARSSDNLSMRGMVSICAEGEPLVNVREVLPRRIVYTHQNSLMRAAGTIAWGERQVQLDPDRDFAAMDYTVGVHTHLTSWQWACGHGEAADGTPLAVNITVGTAPDNGIACWWVGTRLHRGAQSRFVHLLPSQNLLITSSDPLLDLQFVPDCRMRVRSIVSLLCQSQGTFHGSVPDADGQALTIGWMSGVTEGFRARW